MPISDAILQKEPPRIAAGRQRTMLELQDHAGTSLGVGPLDSDLPWAIRGRPVGAQISAEVDQKRTRLTRRQQLVGSVDGVFLCRACPREMACWRFPLETR
jgi:hypothetical protein